MIPFNHYLSLLLLSNFIWINSSMQGDNNSHLFPPGSFGLNHVSEYNVTGPLNSFVEQIQANSRSQSLEIPQMQHSFPQNQAQSQIPIVQLPPHPQGTNSVVYAQAQVPPIPVQQPQPVIIGPQNRPSIDPALQQLLNSFNTNPTEAQRNTFLQSGPAVDVNTPAVSYITCYVGCSHVTNIVTNAATKCESINHTITAAFLIISMVFLFY